MPFGPDRFDREILPVAGILVQLVLLALGTVPGNELVHDQNVRAGRGQVLDPRRVVLVTPVIADTVPVLEERAPVRFEVRNEIVEEPALRAIHVHIAHLVGELAAVEGQCAVRSAKGDGHPVVVLVDEGEMFARFAEPVDIVFARAVGHGVSSEKKSDQERPQNRPGRDPLPALVHEQAEKGEADEGDGAQTERAPNGAARGESRWIHERQKQELARGLDQQPRDQRKENENLGDTPDRPRRRIERHEKSCRAERAQREHEARIVEGQQKMEDRHDDRRKHDTGQKDSARVDAFRGRSPAARRGRDHLE